MQILRNTFLHIPGVDKKIEHKIWKSNIYSWEEFLQHHHKVPMSSAKKETLHSHIQRSIQAYASKDYDFFADSLPPRLHWRAYPELKNKCCFLDIETTGLDPYNDDITLIGIYNGKQSKFFVKDNNLEQFQHELEKYPMAITFNGSCFDFPFIQAKFPHLKINPFHVDLRFAMKELGFSGGLKRIEKLIGMHRPEDVEGVDGMTAVRLWYRYKRGDYRALRLLIKYNKADIENLKALMDFTFKQLREKEFLSLI